jgi:hypothetical protein
MVKKNKTIIAIPRTGAKRRSVARGKRTIGRGRSSNARTKRTRKQ